MPKANKDVAPNRDWTTLTQLGIKADALATQYAAQLAGRLDPNLLTTLAADLASMNAVVPAAKTAQEGSKQATQAQITALATAYNSVSAVRVAVGRKKPSKDVAAAYSVGVRVNPELVKDVTNALQIIITRATDNPAEAATFGIVAADVALYKTQLAAVQAADQAQEKARAGAPLSTKARNVTARRIMDAVNSVAGAGILAFANSPTERASFQALIQKGG